MDKDQPPTDPVMPRTTSFESATASREAASTLVAAKSGSTSLSAPDPSDRGGIFAALVKDDSDITGLVAYSIYKQNRLDWHKAFEASQGRAPNEGELSAYIIGESTPRRLATYRHLAEATLAGNGPSTDGSRPTRAATARLGDAEAKTLTNGLFLTYGLIAVLFVVVLWFALHVGH